MTQTLPRKIRSDRCKGEGGWFVADHDGGWWTACQGCCTCQPTRYVAPAKVAKWKTAQVFEAAPSDEIF